MGAGFAFQRKGVDARLRLIEGSAQLAQDAAREVIGLYFKGFPLLRVGFGEVVSIDVVPDFVGEHAICSPAGFRFFFKIFQKHRTVKDVFILVRKGCLRVFHIRFFENKRHKKHGIGF